jgi:hypothetical protein
MGEGKFSATRKLLVDWPARELLRSALLTWPGAIYPYRADWNVRCRHVNVEPWAGISESGGLASYEWAILTAEYSTPNIGDAQPYPADKDWAKHLNPECALSETWASSVEGVRLPYTNFTWSDGTTILPDEAPTKPLYRGVYNLSRFYLPQVPDEAAEWVGMVNTDPITTVLLFGGAKTFAPNTLMLGPCQMGAQISPTGLPSYQVSYPFIYREETWLQHWRADKKAFDWMLLASDGSDYLPCGAQDFRTLFP